MPEARVVRVDIAVVGAGPAGIAAAACAAERGASVVVVDEGLGITTALGTGRLLADLVAGREPALDAAPYAPGRLLAEA